MMEFLNAVEQVRTFGKEPSKKPAKEKPSQCEQCSGDGPLQYVHGMWLCAECIAAEEK